MKGRSLAIQKTTAALEASGFALPEPIYRLRFDPRSASLPFENIADRDGVEWRAKKPKPDAEAPHADVTPRNEIDDMVEEEREKTPKKGDLLDHRRPVE